MGIHVVLFQPEIPQNTGNISRTCDCAGATLHLVHPFGFHLTERNLRRAGMDYFERADIVQWPSTDAFLEAHAHDELFLFTGRATKCFSAVDFAGLSELEVFLCFGRESTGLDDEVLERFPERCVRIPMAQDRRSLNLANSVSIGLYEALRQQGYPKLI